MKTKKIIPLRTRTRKGKVLVVSAVATIHKILDEIASGGQLHCNMTTMDNKAQFVFKSNGIRASFQIMKQDN